MKPSEALVLHLTQRPQMPRPFDPDSAEAESFRQALQFWSEKKGDLEIDARLEGIQIITNERQQPACSPRADYDWRDMTPKRIHRAKPAKKVWDGATKEYNRQKQAERRARVRQAVHEVQAERDVVQR